ncbi:MAG: hypothetical protein LBQ79_07790 [Deltaproteobacteria bacterium]|jgi:hypothetical protein|nr:hypothetical protein [Deltaproteobacteria bacterium]
MTTEEKSLAEIVLNRKEIDRLNDRQVALNESRIRDRDDRKRQAVLKEIFGPEHAARIEAMVEDERRKKQ